MTFSWGAATSNGCPISSLQWSTAGSGGPWNSSSLSGGSTTQGNSYTQSYSVWVLATDSCGLTGEPGSGSTGPPPPTPSITVSRGAAGSISGQCTTGSCSWLNVSMSDFSPDTSYTLNCYNSQGETYSSAGVFSYTTDGSGNFSIAPSNSSTRGCIFGDPDATGIYVIIGNVKSNIVSGDPGDLEASNERMTPNGNDRGTSRMVCRHIRQAGQERKRRGAGEEPAGIVCADCTPGGRARSPRRRAWYRKDLTGSGTRKTVQGTSSRIQFTPDLLPSDVTGVNIYDQRSGKFDFHKGPIFASIVLADEINRASPKTQSALLEVMEEQHVTVDGVQYDSRAPPSWSLRLRIRLSRLGRTAFPRRNSTAFL